MNRLPRLLVVLGVFFGFSLMAAPVFAQAQRTWVSGTGDDSNSCSPVKPCRTFAGALSKTATGGEINCLDSGAFGALTITKSVSIVCDGVIGAISAGNGGNGIVINGSGIKVLISGLEISGFDVALTGVQIRDAANVIIRQTSIRNFSQRGVDLQGTSGNSVSILDSEIIGSQLAGFFMEGQSGTVNNALIERTFFSMNGGSIQVVGPSLAFISDSTSADAVSFDLSGGAQVFSFGTNILLGKGTPTVTLPLL